MYSVLLVVAAADGIAFGLGALLLPDMLAGIFGVALLEPFGRVAFQQLGALTIGLGVLDALARNLREAAGRRAVVVGNIVAFALIAVTAGSAAASGTANILGWGVAAFHAIVGIALAYAQFAPVNRLQDRATGR